MTRDQVDIEYWKFVARQQFQCSLYGVGLLRSPLIDRGLLVERLNTDTDTPDMVIFQKLYRSAVMWPVMFRSRLVFAESRD